MNLHQIFFILSVITSFISQGIGIYFIFKGTFKPQRTTRFIYVLLSSIFLGTLIVQGSWQAFGLAFAQGLGGLIIFILSFKYGMGGHEKIDIFTLIGAGIVLILWKTTDNPTLALLLTILIETIAFFPTIVKIYKQPRTEEWRFYLCDMLSSSFSLLSLQRLLIGDIAYPIYVFTINIFAMIFILLRTKQTSKVETTRV